MIDYLDQFGRCAKQKLFSSWFWSSFAQNNAAPINHAVLPEQPHAIAIQADIPAASHQAPQQHSLPFVTSEYIEENTYEKYDANGQVIAKVSQRFKIKGSEKAINEIMAAMQ